MTEVDSRSQDDASRSTTRLQSLYEIVDILLLLALFVGLVALAMTYEESARQFPLVFLYAGIAVLGIQLLIELLPDQYSVPLQRYTSGLADDMALEDDEGDEAAGDTTAAGSTDETVGDRRHRVYRLALIMGLVVGYFLAAYLIGFLFATPVFVFAAVFTLGSRNYRVAVVLSILLMIMVYYLFGELMNVPIMEGILLS